jgi:hypothetical protein
MATMFDGLRVDIATEVQTELDSARMAGWTIRMSAWVMNNQMIALTAVRDDGSQIHFCCVPNRLAERIHDLVI